MRSIEFQSDNPQAHFNLAVTLSSKFKDHENALFHLETANQLGYDTPKVLHLKANILQDLGKQAEAELCYAEAEEIAKENNVKNELKSSTNKHLRLPILLTKLHQTINVDVDGKHYNMTCISKSPLIFYSKSLISPNECKYIINKSKKKLEKSLVMGSTVNYDTSLGNDENQTSYSSDRKDDDPFRLSYNTWLPRNELLNSLQERIASLVGLSPSYVKQNSEELQVF